MSASKYFIYSERWREVDACSGAVAGWAHRARFVYLRRGRLRVARRRRVLAALQAFAAHRPSAIGLGPRLSVLSEKPTERHINKKSLPDVQQYGPPHHCCAHYIGCNNIHCLPGAAPCVAVAPPCVSVAPPRVTVDAAVQHLPPENHTLTISLTNLTKPVPPPATTMTNVDVHKSDTNKKRAPSIDALLDNHSTVRNKRAVSHTDTDSDELFHKPNKAMCLDTESQKSTAVSDKSKRKKSEDEVNSDNMCKELTIPEEDVLALRSYVARSRSAALERFDADDEYKLALFYAINPLVYVSRCPLTERAIRERLPLALTPFAARLGLAPSPKPRAPRTRQESDSENHFQKPTRNELRSIRNKPVAKTTPCRDITDHHHQKYNLPNTQKHNIILGTDSESGKEITDETLTESDTLYSDSDSVVVTEKRRNSLRKRNKTQIEAENKNNSNARQAKIEAKYNLLPKTTETQANNETQDSDSGSDIRANIKNRRNSLYKRNETQMKADNKDAQSARQAKIYLTHKKIEAWTKDDIQDSDSDTDGRTNIDDRRNLLRKKNQTQMEDDTEDSENNSEKRANIENRRSALRKRNETQTKADSKDADSTKKFKTKQNLSVKKSETQIKNYKQHSESDSFDQANNENRRNALRKRNETQTKADSKVAVRAKKFETKHNLSGKKSETQMKSYRQHPESGSEDQATIENKRNSLRKRNEIQTKSDSKAADSARQAKLAPKHDELGKRTETQNNYRQHFESDSDDQTTIENRWNSLRKRNETKSKAGSKEANSTRQAQFAPKHDLLGQKSEAQTKNYKQQSESDSDDQKAIENRRNSLRKRNEVQKKLNSLDSHRDRQVKNEHKVKLKQESDRGKEKVNKRISLPEGVTVPTKVMEQSDSDYESEKHKTNDKNKLQSSNKRMAQDNSSEEQTESDERRNTEKSSERKRERRRHMKNIIENINGRSLKTKSIDKLSSRGPFMEQDKNKKTKQSEPFSSDSDDTSEPKDDKEPFTKKPVVVLEKKTHTISKRASASGAKEYSNLEDHAIVAWVLNGGRASKVNGNRLWQELAENYTTLTGVSRSWHSLRNRYLRYILPALGALQLPPRDQQHLRAAAARGELKAKRNGLSAERRNSIFHHSDVRTASARHAVLRPETSPNISPKIPSVSSATIHDEAEQVQLRSDPTTRAATHSPQDNRGGERRSRRFLASAPASATTKARTRKLFNPKVVL